MFTKIKNWFTTNKKENPSVDLMYTYNLHYKVRMVRNDNAPGSYFDSIELEAKVRARTYKEAVRLLRETVKRKYELQIIVWDDTGVQEIL